VLRELAAASKATLTAKQAERLRGTLQFICNSSILGGAGLVQQCAPEAWNDDWESALLFLKMILQKDRLPQ
jgi:hypothetical protein